MERIKKKGKKKLDAFDRVSEFKLTQYGWFKFTMRQIFFSYRRASAVTSFPRRINTPPLAHPLSPRVYRNVSKVEALKARN